MSNPESHFYEELSRGNIATAYNFLFSTDSKLSRCTQQDAALVFSDILQSGTYHSVTVCETIRNKILSDFKLSKRLKHKLREVTISEPEHPRIIFPSVTAGGTGMLFYLRCRQTEISHLNKCHKHSFDKASKIVFQQMLHIITMYYLMDTRCKNVYRYHLQPALIPQKYSNCNLQDKSLESSALASALFLYTTYLTDQHPDIIACDDIILATGCWDSGKFTAAGLIEQKLKLLKREFPEVPTVYISAESEIAGNEFENVICIKSFDDIVSLFVENKNFYMSNIDLYFQKLKKRIVDKKLDTIDKICSIHEITQIDIPSSIEHRHDLAAAILYIFKLKRKYFLYEDALKFGQYLDRIIKTEIREFATIANSFYPIYCQLLTSLYRFKSAADYCRLATEHDTPESLSLQYCLLAEAALLSKKFEQAEDFINRAKYHLRKRHESRFMIYSARIRLAREPDSAVHVLADLEAKSPLKPIDRLYWYSLRVKCLVQSGKDKKALETVIDFEREYTDMNLPFWPVVLFYRFAAIAANKTGDPDTAQKWLLKPQAESIQNCFILKVHQSASELLWWSMLLAEKDHEAAGSPEQICKPLEHNLLNGYFKNDIDKLITAWKSEAAINSLVNQVEYIVQKTYE